MHFLHGVGEKKEPSAETDGTQAESGGGTTNLRFLLYSPDNSLASGFQAVQVAYRQTLKADSEEARRGGFECLKRVYLHLLTLFVDTFEK